MLSEPVQQRGGKGAHKTGEMVFVLVTIPPLIVCVICTSEARGLLVLINKWLIIVNVRKQWNLLAYIITIENLKHCKVQKIQNGMLLSLQRQIGEEKEWTIGNPRLENTNSIYRQGVGDFISNYIKFKRFGMKDRSGKSNRIPSVWIRIWLQCVRWAVN